MRKMIYVMAVVGVEVAVGCTSGGGMQSRGNVEADSIAQGSVCDADSTLGEWVKIGYATPMTDSRAVHYNLTITHRQHSGDGRFAMRVADLTMGKTEEYAGRRFTQRGIPSDNDATVWQLVCGDEDRIFNFLYDSKTNCLTLLDSQYELTDVVLIANPIEVE